MVMAAQRENKGRGGTIWMALAGGMALGALVAAAFFWMHTAGLTKASRALASAPQGGAATLVTTAPAQANDGKAVRPASEERGVDPSTLPAAPSPIAEHSIPRTAPAAAVRVSGGASAPPSAPSPAAAATAPTRVAQIIEGPAGAGPSTAMAAASGSEMTLEAMMKRAVGATARPALVAPPAAVSAAPIAGNLPPKPAMGAVQGSLGTVLPAARYCLGPDDPISRAAITFKSDGSVQSVAISGDAAGQPAEACIRSRLMTARVPPFANPTFTWTVTVRPAS
jgi:hypothetical protein